MALSSEQLMIIFNLLLCAMGSFVCICRMAKMKGSATKGEVRLIYMVYFVIYAGSGISYTWHEPATYIQIFIGGGLLSVLFISFGAWRHGPPAHTFKSVYQYVHDQAASITGGYEPLKTDARHE